MPKGKPSAVKKPVAKGKSGAEKKPQAKGDKSRRQKEEAERKAKEEEEARIRAEHEEAERKEREKAEAEEMLRLETEERRKRKGQLAELDAILTNNHNKLYAAKLETRKAARWARYMRCDGSPDPSVLAEINMYLTVWREDQKNTDFESILKEAMVVLQLIEELDNLSNDTLDPDLTEMKTMQYKETISTLQDILQEKLDLSTHDLMLKATTLAPPDSNLIQTIGNDVITLCLWGNLTKNPRLKSFDFDSKGMVFELNPALNRADCVVRALFEKFDHLSHQSKAYYPRTKQKKQDEEPPENGNSAGDGDAKEGQAEGSVDQQVEEFPVPKDTKPESTGRPSHEGDSVEEVEIAAEEAEEEEEETEDAEDDAAALKTPEPLDYEEFDREEDVVDLRGFLVVGGVFHINLCELPPQPKHANKWKITLLVDPPELHFMDYVAEVVQPKENKELKTEESTEVDAKPSAREVTDKKEKDIEKTPITVTLRLPDDVCFCEEPQVARWDNVDKVWRTDGFLDKVYNEVGRQLTFRICRFGSMALLQDSHINMPFQSWELRPHNTNHAQLTIIAAILEVEFQIKGDMVCLSQPENKPELNHLLNKWMSVRDLIKKMRESGVNVFPAEDSFKYVKIPDKNPLTENRLYRQMSLVGSAMAFSWSRWNLDVNDREKIIVQATEHLVDEPLLEEDWSLFQITKRRTTKLKMTEYSEMFSGDHAEGTEFHADLYHMVMDIVSEQAQERIRDTSADFSETVYSFLQQTRVITYS